MAQAILSNLSVESCITMIIVILECLSFPFLWGTKRTTPGFRNFFARREAVFGAEDGRRKGAEKGRGIRYRWEDVLRLHVLGASQRLDLLARGE